MANSLEKPMVAEEPVRYMHFLMSLRSAHALVVERISEFHHGYFENQEMGLAIVSLAVDAVLHKQATGDTFYDPAKCAVEDLESLGFAKPTAHEVFHQLFDEIATTVTDLIPDFGDERYRENYAYTMRNRLDLHIAIAEHAFQSFLPSG